MALLTASTHSNPCKSPLQIFLPFCFSKKSTCTSKSSKGSLSTKWHRKGCYSSEGSCKLKLMLHHKKTSRPCPRVVVEDTETSHPCMAVMSLSSLWMKSIVVPLVQSPGHHPVQNKHGVSGCFLLDYLIYLGFNCKSGQNNPYICFA